MRSYRLAFLLSALFQPAVCIRSENSSENSDGVVSSHNVKILVTRHALSWANIANDWVGTVYHTRMKDPLLTQVGMIKSEQISEDVKTWLAERNWKLDAVISSNLLRAIETALLQYPAHKVNVVPFIAEMGFGADNSAREIPDQKEYLQKHLTGRAGDDNFKVDFHWAEVLKSMDDRKWSKFLNFLEEFFLPPLLAQREAAGIGKDVPIVLAVVTHSNFMGKGEIADRCNEFYPISPKGKSKPNNNQVLSLGYKLNGKADSNWDVTTRYELVPHGECEPVHVGVSPWDENGNRHELCISDVGQDAIDYIDDKTGHTVDTLDTKLKVDYERIVAKIDKFASLRPKKKHKPMKSRLEKGKEIADLTAQLRFAKIAPCWGGGHPADPEASFAKIETLFPFARQWEDNDEEPLSQTPE